MNAAAPDVSDVAPAKSPDEENAPVVANDNAPVAAPEDMHFTRIAAAVKRAREPVKICPAETAPEIRAETAWSDLLMPVAGVPTSVRQLGGAACKRYTPDHLLLLLDEVLDGAECARLNDAAEAIGYGRTNYPQEYRGNLRLLITDPALAAALWERVRPFVPATLSTADSQDGNDTWVACGLNECFRLAKYYPGTRFGAHCDARFERHAHEKSFYTVNIYTNSVPAEHGGRTRFYAEQRRRGDDCCVDLAVKPEAGLAAIFRHGPRDELLHDGEELRGGIKYLLRTDVMYRRRRDAEDGPRAHDPECGPNVDFF